MQFEGAFRLSMLIFTGQVQPQQYMLHTHQVRQAVHEARRASSMGMGIDINQFILRLFHMGVRAQTVTMALNNPMEMQRLGVFENDITMLGRYY